MPTSSFSPEALLRAMAPIDMVIEAFASSLADDEDGGGAAVSAWATPEVGQRNFAHLVFRVVSQPFTPSTRYLRRLLTRYASKVERDAGLEIEDEALAELIADHAFGPSCCGAHSGAIGGGLSGGDVPDPNAPGYVSFHIPDPKASDGNDSRYPDTQVGVRVFTHHNDVGCKLWEAGAALAEYLLAYPEQVKDRIVLELGAGVGLTGIVVAGMCGAKRLHMTDYTEACLENIKHNIDSNNDWLSRRGVNVEGGDSEGTELTSGYLEWKEYAEDADGLPNAFAFSDADVLLAADVVYDVLQIPDLVRTVRRLLRERKKYVPSQCERKAIFATTYRNENTFALFRSELRSEGIKCEYLDKERMEKLPQIFPVYYHQPRDDVRICTMTAEY